MADATTVKPDELGVRLKEARREAGGISQSELAELLGVTKRSVQLYESGKVVPYRHLRELEEILGRPVAWFLYGDDGVRGSRLDVRALRDEERRRHEDVLRRLDSMSEALRELLRRTPSSS